MQTSDFFRSRIDAMLNLSDPLAVLATRLPWSQLEAAVAAKFEHQNRTGQVLKDQDMFGTTEVHKQTFAKEGKTLRFKGPAATETNFAGPTNWLIGCVIGWFNFSCIIGFNSIFHAKNEFRLGPQAPCVWLRSV